MAAQAFIGRRSGLLFSRNVIVQIIALAVLSALIVVRCAVRERRSRRPAPVRSVAEGAVRLMTGDVRGDGLPAVGEAALVLGAFREAAHQHAGLPEPAAALERSIWPSLPGPCT